MFPRFVSHWRPTALACAALAAFWPAGQCAAFTIQLNPGSGLAANTDALASFERAAQEWEALITNNVTVHVDVDLLDFHSSSIIGSTGFTSYDAQGLDINLPYKMVRDAMAARSTRPGDAILQYLPTSGQITALTPANATLDKTTIGVLRANQRALGLLDNSDTRADGIIQFNTGFTFDYDRSNGIDSGKMDFEAAAAHEIGHLLGFESDVDDFDRDNLLTSDNLTTLDLFRFPTTAQPTNSAEFQSLPRELTPGAASVWSDTLNSYDMSTGANQGDGNQASHWKDDGAFSFNFSQDKLIGIMDPTIDFGVTELIKSSDVRAFELIGYDTVPEPGTMGLLVAGAGVLGLRRRRA